MSSAHVAATRTYLELTNQDSLRPVRLANGNAIVTRRDECEPYFWRHLYATVGAAYHWVDRLPWTDDEIRGYLSDPAVSLWTLTVDGTLAGYFELRREDARSTEIVYFGLFPEFTGRGLGGFLLTAAVVRAWAAGATRVWLHTCSFDHPVAIQNYQDRGFVVFKTEEYLAVRPIAEARSSITRAAANTPGHP